MIGRKAVILGVVVLVSAAGCRGKNPVVAKVNGKSITMADLRAEIEKLPMQMRGPGTLPAQGKTILEGLINREIIREEAERRGLAKDPAIEKRVEEYRAQLITQRLMDSLTEGEKITDQDIGKYYTDHIQEFHTPEMVRVSQIVTKTPEEAKKILAWLKRGEDFSALAKTASVDGFSRDKGGDIGFVSRGRLLPDVEKAVFGMKGVGGISGVIRTPFGYQIVKITDRKPESQTDLSQVKEQIRFRLQQAEKKDTFEALLSDLKKKAHITIYEKSLEKAHD